jgi:DNA-binding XRE family transcriptional regulator
MRKPSELPVSAEEREERKSRARDWKTFRKTFLFTQKFLADTVGISRRTIQEIEAGNITPHPATLRTFHTFRMKHESNNHPKKKRKSHG